MAHIVSYCFAPIYSVPVMARQLPNSTPVILEVRPTSVPVIMVPLSVVSISTLLGVAIAGLVRPEGRHAGSLPRPCWHKSSRRAFAASRPLKPLNFPPRLRSDEAPVWSAFTAFFSRVDATCARVSATGGVTAALIAGRVFAARADEDCFAPSAAPPLCDNARLRANAAARVEFGAAVLFAIASLMFLSFRNKPEPIH